MSDAFERVRDLLTSANLRIADNRQNHFMSQCPHHDDNGPSLAVDDKGDRVILHCHAGCHTDDVIADLGLGLADLFDNDLTNLKGNNYGQLVRSYLYERTNGEPWFFVDRFYPKTFRQRLPDAEPVRDLSEADAHKRLGLRGRDPIIYHAPRIYREMAKAEPTTVWWLDGEKDVETAEREGLIATCPPGFAKWDMKYAEFLRHADLVMMVVDQDKEKPDGTLGAGQINAQTARNGFRSLGVKVKAVSPAVGKDLTDHFAAGYGVEDFVPEPTIYTRPRGMKADALEVAEFEPLQWAVNHLIPSGLTILAGPPKKGKTWIGLGFSLAVASGGPALSMLETTQGSVLHLAREDGYRRLQSRIQLLMGGYSGAPPALEVIPTEEEWVGGEQGLANMTEWAEEVDNPRLVVIDTLAKVEPEMGEDRNRGAYAGNYAMMARYKQWADMHNVAVVLIHHDNKTKVDANTDPFSRISGTRGLTGAADTLLFLDVQHGAGEGVLHVTGRDVSEMSLSLSKRGPLWVSNEPL